LSTFARASRTAFVSCALVSGTLPFARLENGEHVAGVNGTIRQQRHLRDRRGDLRTHGRFTARGESCDRRDLLRDCGALGFRDLNADHDIRGGVGGGRCLVATLPDDEDQEQRGDRGRRDAHSPVAPPHLALFIRGRFPKNTH